MSAGVFALVATGGTGGHTYPAIALAATLVARGYDRSAIRFVGGRRGLEGRVVPESGFEIDLLPVRGLQRRLTVANLRVLFEAVVAFGCAVGLVRRHRPQVVVGFGGHASLPCLVAARLLRVPCIVHEQNAAPGLANRIAVRMGARPAISLPGTPLPGALLTGNPVRPELVALDRVQREPPLVAVFGGSLGSRTLNEASLEIYDRWRDRGDVVIRHASGTRFHDECVARLEELRRPSDRLRYELVPYEEHMATLYRRAAVAVCRAGASSVAELTAVGLPSVLVPLPGAPSDHQTRNARSLEIAGAAVLLPDERCDGSTLAEVVSGLLDDPSRLATMSAASRALARPDAAERLADLVEEYALA